MKHISVVALHNLHTRCFCGLSSFSEQPRMTHKHVGRGLCFTPHSDELIGRYAESKPCCVFLTWELMQCPSNLSLGYIHRLADHVTVLMLRNALVHINRPGWQDKFTFMPEEEKTSISLTQKLHHYRSGGSPLNIPRSHS